MEFDAAISLFADASEKLGKSAESITGRRVKPVHKSLGCSYPGETPAPVTAVQMIVPQTPAVGRVWVVHTIGIFGTDPHTAVPDCIADVYAGPGQEVDFPSVIYSNLSVPTVINEGHWHNPVHAQEQVYALVYDVPAAQQLVFCIGVTEWPVEIEELSIP